MLDQNTDRMWYVIGAVLVGAAIILIANGTLPQMFASVSQSFNSVIELVNIPESDPNMINQSNYQKGFLHAGGAGSQYTIAPRTRDGVYMVSVKPNTTYRIEVDGLADLRRVSQFTRNSMVGLTDDIFRNKNDYVFEFTTRQDTYRVGVGVEMYDDNRLFDGTDFTISMIEVLEVAET